MLQDVAGKILTFAQKGHRGICVLSANGSVSNVTLRQPGTSGGLLTYEVYITLLIRESFHVVFVCFYCDQMSCFLLAWSKVKHSLSSKSRQCYPILCWFENRMSLISFACACHMIVGIFLFLCFWSSWCWWCAFCVRSI